MKNIFKLILFIFSILLINGCVRSKTPEQTPTIATQGDIMELDWQKISNEIDNIYTNKEKYPMLSSVNYNLDEENSVFNIVLFVEKDTTPDVAVQYITDVTKRINDLAAAQNPDYTVSTKDSFGSLYENYALQLQVIPENPYTPEENYLVEQLIPAGKYQEIKENVNYE